MDPTPRFPLLLALLVALSFAPGRARADEAPPEPGVPDAALQKQIDEAIDKGAAWLRARQKDSGLIGAVSHQGNLHYEIGTTALAGLALLAAGDEPGSAAVDKALAYCKSKDLVRGQSGARTTYDTGTLLMFVTEYYRPRGKEQRGAGKERYAKPAKGKGGRGPCALPEDAFAWVRDMAQWLARQQQAAGGWGYPQNREDFSNTQYALLGLRAARECGVPIPPMVWMRALERALALQEKEGEKVLRTLRSPDGKGPVYKIDGGDRARGWGYTEDSNVATGSMTTAGIAILAICHTALLDPKRFPQYTRTLENQVTRAIQDGFSWLDLHFSVTRNPGRAAPPWHYYYLYGLERAAVLGGRDLLGDHDWYVEGARYLVGAQRGDGSWHTGFLGTSEYEANDALDTAWAILFLARATRPAKPIQPPAVTPSGN